MDDLPISLDSYNSNPNPFDTTALLPPFVGREQEFSRLHQHLTDLANTHAVVYLGRWRGGKTALLQHFDQYFDETFIGVYIPLQQVEFSDDAHWMMTLIESIQYYVKARGFMPNVNIDEQEEAPTTKVAHQDTDLRVWFKGVFLPDVYRVIRPQRRLALLLDDIQLLIEAVRDSRLSEDTFAYLHSLMGSQFGVALTLPVENEDLIPRLEPLSRNTDVHRLRNLSQEECVQLFSKTIPHITDEAVQLVHTMTGGDPFLLQQFGYPIYETYRSTSQAIHPNDIQIIRTKIQDISHDYLLTIWRTLSQNERLVLTALAELYRDNPLKHTNASIIETWLVETDYPTDITAINATIRSLEYSEIIIGGGGQLLFVSTLMRDWIIQHGSISSPKHVPSQNETQPRQLWLIVGAVIVIMILILFAISQSESSTNRSNTPVPTVTLIPQNED